MAKWLRDYLSFGGRRPPPQPPTPDYSDSDILRAYRAQKNLDFEDPYEDAESRLEPEPAGPGDCKGPGGDAKYDSPKHRLIKVEAADMARAKALLGSPGEEVRGWVAPGGAGEGGLGSADPGELVSCVIPGGAWAPQRHFPVLPLLGRI
uniref:SHD n=1 Tax=Prolemur simus TaxID=1328070 RepID=A0A8C9A3X9_PROSS